MVLYKNFFIDNNKRCFFRKNEVFFYSFGLYDQAQYSNNLVYFSYKRRLSFLFFSKIRNSCAISGRKRSVLAKLKVSRRILSHNILYGTMPGFYQAV
jgi:ribosomal protein S14